MQDCNSGPFASVEELTDHLRNECELISLMCTNCEAVIKRSETPLHSCDGYWRKLTKDQQEEIQKLREEVQSLRETNEMLIEELAQD